MLNDIEILKQNYNYELTAHPRNTIPTRKQKPFDIGMYQHSSEFTLAEILERIHLHDDLNSSLSANKPTKSKSLKI